MKVKGKKKRKLSFYEPNTPGNKLILVGPVCRATDNGCVIVMALLGYGLPFTGLAGSEGISKATPRDGEKGEAALHPEILTPVPNRQTAARVGVLSDLVRWKGRVVVRLRGTKEEGC